jgi:alpha-glucosidase
VANEEGGAAADATPWWRDGVLYQIYPRSFASSTRGPSGDLEGVVERLDHLHWLGVDGIWLNPTMPSPNDDWGYDVADYYGVHPDFGDLEALERLVAEARRRAIHVILDLVPNHTSDRHAWFVESRASRDAERREWYVWADGRPDGGPPNNWRSVFGGGPGWQLDEASGQWYLHNFLPSMPDLNWWSDEVRDEFDRILRFWFDRGIAGFRIDVAHALVKDSELRDNPPADESDPEHVRRVGQRSVYNMNRPEGHDVLKRWRAVTQAYDSRPILIGETYVFDLEALARFYGSGEDELHLAFNLPFATSPFEVGRLREVVERTEALLPERSWPVWTASNHDIGRFPSRWCDGQRDLVRCALLLLLTLRGTPLLYYGDEIGMEDVPIPRERLRDPVGIESWPKDRGRDGCRTPMQWSGEPGAGFSAPGVEPWLPIGEARACNVADQRDDPTSELALCRDLIALRRRVADLRRGAYGRLEAPRGAWAFARGDGHAVALNTSASEVSVPGLDGSILIGTRRERDGERVRAALALGPGEAVVVERQPGA